MAAAFSLPHIHPASPPPEIRAVTLEQSGRWLAAGWRDMWAMPQVSFVYGGLCVALSYLLTLGLASLDMDYLALPAMAGFMLVAPVLAIAFYEVSHRLETGSPVTLAQAALAWRVNKSEIAVLGGTLMLFLLAWFRLATLIYAMFYGNSMPNSEDPFGGMLSIEAIPFLAVGCTAGAILAALVYAISAVSMPMLLDRHVSAFTAMQTSFNAVRLNWRVMSGWAAMIALITLCGLMTFYIGLIIALPLVGHASWHAYRALVVPVPADSNPP